MTGWLGQSWGGLSPTWRTIPNLGSVETNVWCWWRWWSWYVWTRRSVKMSVIFVFQLMLRQNVCCLSGSLASSPSPFSSSSPLSPSWWTGPGAGSLAGLSGGPMSLHFIDWKQNVPISVCVSVCSKVTADESLTEDQPMSSTGLGTLR